MWLQIQDKKFFISSKFEQSIFELKKKNQLKVKISKWYSEADIELFKFKDGFPKSLLMQNTYYFWVFENCELVGVKFNNLGIESKTFSLFMTFNFSDVWGTTSQNIIERNFKLNQIID